MPVFAVDPLTDARWDELVSRHARSGVFHTSSWLSSLQKTYRYEPVAFTTSPRGEPLKNGLVFCKVESWVTGRRLVSLPFSDHCALLSDSEAEQETLLSHLCEQVVTERYAHAEIRPMTTEQPAPLVAARLEMAETYCLHRLPLSPPVDALFQNLHRTCIQRKIRRAEREELTYESGRSQTLLHTFYDLLIRTRRRQYLPPQPLRWFLNLVDAMGDNLTIRLVSKGNSPVAAILTLSHKTTVTFKYGCSDERFHKLGGTPFLLWKTIQESKNQGMSELDLGRSELSHAGLVQFKDRLGAVRTMMPYWQYPSGRRAGSKHSPWQIKMARKIFSWVPDPLIVASSRLLYRHIG